MSGLPQERVPDGARGRAWAAGFAMARDMPDLWRARGQGAQEGGRASWVREEAGQRGEDGQGRGRVVSRVLGQ